MAQRRKIVFLINSLLSGGAEKQSLYLTKLLSSEHEVFLIVLHNQCSLRNQEYLVKNGINPTFLKGSSIKKMHSLYLFFRKNKIEFVFSFLFAANLITAIIGKLASVPILVGGFRGSMGYGRIKNQLLKLIHRHFTHATICNNHAGYEYLVNQGFAEHKLKVIHNGIDVNIRLSKEKPDQTLNILSVGRFDKLKDYKTAIEAIGLLKSFRKGMIHFRYTIVGYGSKEIEQNIKQWVQDNSVQDIFQMVVDPAEIYPYFSTSSIYLSTSIFEGLSNSIMEAMVHGLPVVATNVGDNKFLIENNVNGFLVNTGDATSIAELLNGLVEFPEKREDMGNSGRQRMVAKFSLSNLQKAYLELIEKLDKESVS